MTTQIGKSFYKIGTKSELPWIEGPAAVFKRVGPFNWENVGLVFDTIEDAQEYMSYLPMLEIA